MNPDEMRAMIAENLDIQDLSPSEQEEIIDKFTENTLKKITLDLFDRLPDEAKAQFAKLGDAGDTAGIQELFQKHIPDLDGFIRATVKAEVDAFKEFQSAA